MMRQRRQSANNVETDGQEAAGEDMLMNFQLSASFLEVYGEDIHDLMDDDRKCLPIREAKPGVVIVKGLQETPVTSDAEAMRILNQGTMNRTTASTLMNRTSSRSHAMFMVNLQQTTRSAEGVDVTSTSRFTFVDLAGSERMKKTGAEGERAREGIKINEGLLALGNVINALADEDRIARGEKVHVPYRQSKLTRLLQDALGGNSQTLFLACVSPSDTNASETLSTLQYANRARNIKNAPTRNVDATALELQRLLSLTNVLRCELIKQRFTEEGAPTSKESGIGVVNEELLKREDVTSYMTRIDEKVAELSGGGGGGASGSSNLAMSFPVHSVAPPLHPTTSRTSILPTTTSSMRSSTSSNKQPTAAISTRTSSRFTMDHAKSQDDFDALILDVNPEEDMQLIDQLLELQHHDHKFSIEQRDDQEKLVDMEGEIVAQEDRLLQLRDNLKVYRSMKDKYEQLMCNVHSLESEKLALAKELDQAQVDPTKGCSTVIKNKLKKVEENLARARSESRKHQQMYRQAEQEVQKCKVLERKIQELKHGKVSLIKKQKDAAAKHKEFTNQKTREIHALKRKERTADKKISKMESEVHKYKSNLERSRSQCGKLSDKLKQTETHLMRLLTKRRTDISHNARNSRQSRVHNNPVQRDLEGMDQFAPVNQEMDSLKFLLEKTVADRVTFAQTKETYTTKVIEHGELMQLLAKEAKVINTWKREYNNTDPNTSVVEDVLFEIKEHEDTVQQLQFKLELVENDLDQLRSKCPSVEEDSSDEDTKVGNSSALKMVSKLDGPVLRTLLWNLLDSYYTTELQRRNTKDALLRKDSTLRSFENEIMLQNEKIDALTKSLERRKKLMSSEDNESDPFEFIHNLEEEVSLANKKIEAGLAENATVLTELEKTRDALSMEKEQHSKVEEQLALLRSQLKLTESTDETAQMLRQLQEVMAAIGMSREERDTVREKLEHCVEDACAQMLADAKSQRDQKGQQVDSLRERLAQMHDALGIVFQLPATVGTSLSNELVTLESKLRKIQPLFDVAVERRARLLNDVNILAFDFGDANLSDNLRQLMQENTKEGPKRARSHSITAQQRVSMASSREGRAKLLQNVEAMISGLETINEEIAASDVPSEIELPLTKSGSLSETFLDDCERDIKKMKHMQSDILLSNVEKCDQLRSLLKQMHVGKNDLPSIVAHGLRKRKQSVPSWWDESVSDTVYSALFRQGSILVKKSFTDHLALMLQTLQAISHSRQLLSKSLKAVIDESHEALLATAEGCGMVNAEDLSRSLQEALQHLPPLSKEHSKACIDEMQMLNEAAEAVAQSEVETLTVLWEGLNVSSNQRGTFWGELEDSTTKLQMTTASPFDHILRECPPEVEEWVLKLLTGATKVHRSLRIRVMKLKRIQEEVERLKKKQDAKNGIMSLNSELNVLNAKLAEFEEKAGDKQRLLNKKANSSSLLEEERYRKQMQSMFVSKLEALRQRLTVWEENEGQIDDADMLSEVVKSMLDNSHRIDAWMNEKTRLMHLRTTKTSRLRENMIAERSNSTGSRPGSASTKRSKGSPPLTFDQTSRSTRSTSSTSADKKSVKSYKKTSSDSSSSISSDGKPKRHKPLTSSSLNPQEQSGDITPKKPLRVNTSGEKAPVLLPFGDLLAETPSKNGKENC
eukprot:scaffold3536_cov203-Skeletonema_marinoi.AAC.8